MSPKLKHLTLVVGLVLGCATVVFAQGVDVEGGRSLEPPAKPSRIYSNRGPVAVTPPAPAPTDRPTFADPQGRLEVIIDAEHGHLKSLRFPTLFEDASARSIDRYIILNGPASSELDDEVINVQSRTDADVPHVIVDCLNRALGIAVRKIYQFDPAHDEVIKTVEIDSPTEKLMTVMSVTVLSEASRKGGYYYQYVSHTAGRYTAIPTASIGESYFVNGRNLQSGVSTVTRPDVGFTYGEVQLSTNGVPEYLAIPAEGFLHKGRVEALLTKEGWQLPRGNWLQVGPGRGAQRKSWLYSATKGTHLMWHANYHKRYFAPAFAPERRLDMGIDLAFDTSFIWPHNAARYKDGRLEMIEGDLELWAAGLNKKWETQPLPVRDSEGTLLWYQNLATFDAAYMMFERLDLDPRSWATLGIAETMYTMGDFFGDHMWFAPFIPHKNEDVFEAKKVSMKEYFSFVGKLQKRWPRFKLFNYERGGYYAHGQTIQRHPEFAFHPIPDGTVHRDICYSPRWEYYFAQMTDKYLQLQKQGVSLYVDWAIPGANAAVLDDGRLIFRSYESGQNAVKKMARAMRDAGGFFYANQPSSPWADFGYIEGGSWDTDTRTDWRFWADRLQLYKLHEFRPNTVVALDMMCDEFIHQCLLYNFVPSTMNRVGVTTNQSWAPQELIRLRWYLREASMAPVPLRPVAWETPDSPLETSVMTLPGTVYLGAYNHITKDHTADLSVDLTPVIGRKPYALWRADVTKGPWAGVVSEQGHDPNKKAGPDSYDIGYKYEAADVTFKPYDNVAWDGLGLKLPGVEIPKRQTVFFFLSTVPVVVRTVEGKDVLWPVSSQPHIHIKRHPDDTLLIENDYTEVVLAVHPDWLAKDAMVGALDEKTGWPTITVRPGTWRLKSDGRLLYESRRDAPERDEAFANAAPPPLTTGGPVGVETLGVQNKIVLQNGMDGYQGQAGEQMTTGQWGRETGHVAHGGGTGPDVIFIYADSDASRHARSLIRFDLEGRVPEGARVIRTELVIYCHKGINGNSALAGYKALKPWTDGKTYWTNWGQGGDEPGYIDETAILSGNISEVDGNYHFSVSPSVVQAWLDRPQTNHGLLLKATRDSNAFHWMADGDTGDNPPKLIIEYNTP